MIEQSLRRKIILGFIFIDIFISVLLGVTMYSYLIEMFIKDFRAHKLSIAKFISFSIDGDVHKKLNSVESIQTPEYQKYHSIIRYIFQSEETVKYIYTLNYQKESENFFYGVDGTVNQEDMVWVESPEFSYNFYVKNHMIHIEYGFDTYLENVDIPLENYKSLKLRSEKRGDHKVILQNEVEIVRIIQESPMRVIIQNDYLDKDHRILDKKIQFENKEVIFQFSFTEKNKPGSDPGADFIEKESTINKIKKIINTKTDFIDEEAVLNSYGHFMSAYSLIKDSNGEISGIVIVDIENSEIKEFKKKFTTVALIISCITFILTTFLSLILAGYFTSPLKLLTDAVEKLSLGNLETLVNLNSKDEFGRLAKSFNAMVNNLKIASEVQYNLISEITQLNDSLEKKVVERTNTIQMQSKELEKQIELAKKIQLSLLPKDTPDLSGAAISFRYQPMMGVGGDLLDFNYANKNDLFLFICDVSGHGVPAAFLATMVKMTVQDCFEKKLSPTRTITRISESLSGKMSKHFLSAIVCRLNLSTGELRFANAGHLPLILVRKDGFGKFISSRGRVINELFSPSCVEEQIQLEDGDKIILYTDGITEARSPKNEMLGEDRLLSIVIQNHHKEVEDLANIIFDEVLLFSQNKDGHFEDDITLLITEFRTKNDYEELYHDSFL